MSVGCVYLCLSMCIYVYAQARESHIYLIAIQLLDPRRPNIRYFIFYRSSILDLHGDACPWPKRASAIRNELGDLQNDSAAPHLCCTVMGT